MGKGAQHVRESEGSESPVGCEGLVEKDQRRNQQAPDHDGSGPGSFPLLNSPGGGSPLGAQSPVPTPAVYSAPKSSFWRDVLTVGLVAGVLVPVFTILAPIGVFSPLYLMASGKNHAAAAYLTLVIGFYCVPLVYSPTWKKVIFRPFLMELTKYVRNFRVLKERELDPTKTYVFCWHPHGRLFYGFAVFCGLFEAWCPELSSKEFFGGINDAMFQVPFLSNLLFLSGLIPCSRRQIDRQLKRGNHVGLIVGGLEEVLEGTFDDKDILYLHRRKGFAKVAMDQGAGLVPVYAFGENALFKHDPAWVLRGWRWINKLGLKLGAPLPIHGVWGLPVPYRKELVIAIGEPLFAAEGETVDAFHARYVHAVEELYRRNVGVTEHVGRELVIV